MSDMNIPPSSPGGNPQGPFNPVSSDEKLFAIFAHIGTIISSFLIPLIIWLVKKDDSKFIDHHGKEALNFQITMFIGYVAGLILTFVLIGVFVLFACWFLSLICARSVESRVGKAFVRPGRFGWTLSH